MPGKSTGWVDTLRIKVPGHPVLSLPCSIKVVHGDDRKRTVTAELTEQQAESLAWSLDMLKDEPLPAGGDL